MMDGREAVFSLYFLSADPSKRYTHGTMAEGEKKLMRVLKWDRNFKKQEYDEGRAHKRHYWREGYENLKNFERRRVATTIRKWTDMYNVRRPLQLQQGALQVQIGLQDGTRKEEYAGCEFVEIWALFAPSQDQCRTILNCQVGDRWRKAWSWRGLPFAFTLDSRVPSSFRLESYTRKRKRERKKERKLFWELYEWTHLGLQREEEVQLRR